MDIKTLLRPKYIAVAGLAIAVAIGAAAVAINYGGRGTTPTVPTTVPGHTGAQTATAQPANVPPATQTAQAATPTLEAVVEQDYIRVKERVSGDGYQPKANVTFGANGIPYYEVQFLQGGVEGTIVVVPQQRGVVLGVESGTSDSVPPHAISSCDGTVQSFRTTPKTSTTATQDPAGAARIGQFLKVLYAAAGINPTDCTIKPQ